MKRLVVTADDFGYSRNVNRAIIKCFRKGTVTSTSLLVNTKYFNESVKLLKLNKNLDVGMHINLTEFKPLAKAKSLTGKNGDFIGKKMWFSGYYEKADKNEIKAEINKQIIKALSSGLKITHINGHNHVHIFPNVIDAAINAAKKHGIGYIRLPDEKIIDKSQRAPKEPQKRNILPKFSNFARSKIIKNRLKMTDSFYGILDMNEMDFGRLSAILSSIDDGTSELMVHPAFADKRGDAFHQSRQREKEINLLTNKRTMQTIKKLKINLANFSRL